MERMWQHQQLREPLIRVWLDALDLHPGDRVLDAGAGPGFVSLQAARRVGEGGWVYAVDTSAEALAFLERMQREQGVLQIERVLADAAAVDLPPQPVDAALVTMMLHHAGDPAAVLRRVADLLATDGRAVVAEFHPDGPCAIGPPREHRLTPGQVEAWAQPAGLHTVRYLRQSDEQYMFLFSRSGS